MSYWGVVWKKLVFEQKNTNTRTVRYMFSIILSIIAILGATVISSTNESYVKLSPSKTTVISGEQFNIDIFAYAHVPVNAIDINIKFTQGNVEIVSVDKALSVLTIWTQEPKVINDSITLSGGTYRRGFVGEHLIATVKVKALKGGKTEFSVQNAQLLAGDGKGTPVTVVNNETNSKKSFIIYDQTADPAEISAALAVSISADIDGDGIVSLKDISTFMAAWYSGDKIYDFNSDNKMNFVDFSIILARSFSNYLTQ